MGSRWREFKINAEAFWPAWVGRGLGATMWSAWFFAPVLAWALGVKPGSEPGAWELDAFSGMGAMAGFLIAGLTILLGLHERPENQSLQREQWSIVTWAFISGTAWWTMAAFAALAHWFSPTTPVWLVFVGATASSVCAGLRALFAISILTHRSIV